MGGRYMISYYEKTLSDLKQICFAYQKVLNHTLYIVSTYCKNVTPPPPPRRKGLNIRYEDVKKPVKKKLKICILSFRSLNHVIIEQN